MKPLNEKSEYANKIEEIISWYEDISSRKEDNYVIANLRLIENLSDNVENSEDKIYIDKIIDTVLDIIKKQREVINELELEAASEGFFSPNNQYGYIAAGASLEEDDSDAEIQRAFCGFLAQNKKSSYTINDYCLRVKKLWKTFYEEHKKGTLPEGCFADVKPILWDGDLMNACDHLEALRRYVDIKSKSEPENRNFANTRAAFNKFDIFCREYR